MIKEFLSYIFKCLWFLLPAALSNHNASLGNSLPLPRALKPLLLKLDIPIDEEIFGRNKTVRGFVVGITTGILVAAIQYLLYMTIPFFKSATLIDYTNINFVLVGFLMGFGALLGDLIKSFFKRRFRKRPGLPWFPFDQLDWILASLILTAAVYMPPINYLIGTIIIYFVVHLCSDRIVQKMGLKKREDVYHE